VWLAAPGAPARLLGPTARSRSGRHAATGPVAYPADGSVMRAAVLDVRTSGCGRTASGRAAIQSLSLLGGAVKARTVELGLSGYVSPVVGEAAYGDTYGAFRGDVPGSWHHGDDIFAKLGTPVVAVASGTLNRVGWEKLGGWRLWVRDSLGNEFYYAHLAAYSPLALRSNRVTAGPVLGLVRHPGAAFTAPPHLHFPVPP